MEDSVYPRRLASNNTADSDYHPNPAEHKRGRIILDMAPKRGPKLAAAPMGERAVFFLIHS